MIAGVWRLFFACPLVMQVILYSFPAVCWVYGAGFIFSTFVSVVFWGGPVLYIYQAVRSNSSTVRIRALKVGHNMFVYGVMECGV